MRYICLIASFALLISPLNNFAGARGTASIDGSFTASIQVVKMVSASSNRKNAQRISVTPHRTITISSTSRNGLNISASTIEDGMQKIKSISQLYAEASTKEPTELIKPQEKRIELAMLTAGNEFHLDVSYE